MKPWVAFLLSMSLASGEGVFLLNMLSAFSGLKGQIPGVAKVDLMFSEAPFPTPFEKKLPKFRFITLEKPWLACMRWSISFE
jgi:hypothetical protein